jgi:hypothetical protein
MRYEFGLLYRDLEFHLCGCGHWIGLRVVRRTLCAGWVRRSVQQYPIAPMPGERRLQCLLD